MSGEVMLAVLLGAFLHASWNTLVKSSPDKFLDTALVAGGGALVACCATPFLPFPAAASWPFLVGSAVIHLGYFTLVAAAYQAGEMSYTYPLMRGTAPLLVALLSGVLLAEHLSPVAWVGVALICGGVVSLAFLSRHPSRPIRAATMFALANAVVIALYTFVDGAGARLSGHALSYTVWLLLLTGAVLALWTLRVRTARLIEHCKRRWHLGIAAGGFSIASYALALWAMTKAPIAPVAALRETSILFGLALATFVLKERSRPARYAAVATIVVGVVALRVA
jgi:drug/metabolite transporter (DMT)-like permease